MVTDPVLALVIYTSSANVSSGQLDGPCIACAGIADFASQHKSRRVLNGKAFALDWCFRVAPVDLYVRRPIFEAQVALRIDGGPTRPANSAEGCVNTFCLILAISLRSTGC
jgi:hypothetical protein